VAPAAAGDVPVACPAVRGAPVLSRVAPTHVTTRAGPIRARIRYDTCFRALCMTRRRGVWVEWPGMPACSRRRTMSASKRRPCLIACGRPTSFRWSKRRCGVDDDSAAAGHSLNNSTQRTTRPKRRRNENRIRQIRCSLRTIRRSGQSLRGFGWDTDTPNPRRELVFPIGSFGHHGLRTRFGWTQAQYLRSSARETQSYASSPPMSTREVKWRRRRPGLASLRQWVIGPDSIPAGQR